MKKSIKFTRNGNYNGRNGNAPMTGIQVADVGEIRFVGRDSIILCPVNSKGPATSTWFDIPKEDIPALIALLQESIGQTPTPANNGENEVRMFHLCTLDSDAGSLGTIRGATEEELNAALRQAVEQCLNADEGTVFLPEIDWDYWRGRHTEQITVTYSEDGQTINQTIEMTYTWEV